MSLRLRVTIAVVITILAIGAASWYGALRLRHWDEIGMAGLSFFPEMPEEKRPPFEMFAAGRVFMVYPTGPAERAGIRGGDYLLAINGVSVKDNKTLTAKAGSMRAGDTAVYRVKRGSRTFEARLRLASPLHIPIFLATLIVHLIVGLAYIAIALLVVVKRPDDRRVMVFFAMMAVGAIYLIGTPALGLDSSNIRGVNAETENRGVLPFLTVMAVTVAFLPLTLHLALIFPRERPVVRSSPHVFRWVYGIPAAMVIGLVGLGLIFTIATAAGDAAEKQVKLAVNVLVAIVTLAGFGVALRVARKGRLEGMREAFWRRPFQSIFFLVAAFLSVTQIAKAIGNHWIALGVGMACGLAVSGVLGAFPVLSCIAFYRSYRDADAEEKRQVKWPLWGTSFALATRIVLTTVMEAIIFFHLFTGRGIGEWFGAAQVVDISTKLLYLLIPFSFAVAILKYRLMNIDVIVRKTVVYAMLSGVIAIVYLAIVGLLGTLLVNVAGVENQTMVIGATLVVALVAVPIRNKLQRFVERTMFRQKFDYPAALRAIGADALAASDLSRFLSSSTEKTQHALQNRAVVIFSSRHDEFIAAAKVGVSDSLLGALRVARAPILKMLDRPFDPRRHALSDDAAAAFKRIEATLVVPINTPGTPANGFIAVAPKLSGGEFDVEDIDFLRSVADQVDIGLDRIRLQREDEDYSQARAIQQTLIPREMPRLAGIDVSGTWQPARTMGGDYYDLIPLSETELAVCIGDVAGKGMPAALLMSGLQAAVRASASSSPRDLCERVRRVVVSSLSGGRFVTFFYATIDTAAMRLRWTNAGHNAPILARTDGSMVRLEEGGPAISRLFRDTRYEEREIALTPGDRIVLFTDGVSEAANGTGEMFEERRIEELVSSAGDVSAEELQQRIAQAATSFAGGEVEDDLTLVVLRVTPPA